MRDSDNDAYSYDAFASVTIASVNNALNQTTSVGGVSTTHDNRGNMTNDGTHAYVYDALNRMTRRAVGEVLQYDAFNRLFQAEDGAAKRRFLYDPGSGSGAGSSEIIAEMTTAGVIEKRYVRGPGADEVLVEYDTSGVSDVRTWLYADERGSIIAGANDSGTRTFVNTYDEFGNPASANTGSFQYTGQLWLDEVELYHYKARQYNPALGRFMQTDPIGYGDGMNMYNYVGSDPMNGVDPSGLARFRGGPTNRDGGGGGTGFGGDTIIVEGTPRNHLGAGQLALWSSGNGNNVIGGGGGEVGGGGSAVASSAAAAVKGDIDESLCGAGGTAVSNFVDAARVIAPSASDAQVNRLGNALFEARNRALSIIGARAYRRRDLGSLVSKRWFRNGYYTSEATDDIPLGYPPGGGSDKKGGRAPGNAVAGVIVPNVIDYRADSITYSDPKVIAAHSRYFELNWKRWQNASAVLGIPLVVDSRVDDTLCVLGN